MNGFSAYHISSRGLKYALAYSAFDAGEVVEADYKKALLNILTAQDFDSIPLVETYGGPITAIGRRRLHDGDLDDVFILSTEEVSKLPQTAPVIRCILEVLSNEHHIVFLTDEDDLITDVVTISMLTSPLIQEYLTLLISKLTSEGWDFNEHHLKSAFVPTYDYPKTIHEELKKLGELVDHPEGFIPSDFDVSKQIVHILSLLQPLKLWEGGQDSKALTSTNYPLKIVTPDYKPGTAGYFAQHPFGAVKEDGNEELAFRLFSEANNWDRLLLLSSDEKYTHLLEQDGTQKAVKKIAILEFVWESTCMEDLVQIFGDDDHPICVNFVGSKYPGIITPQDIVYSEFNKTHMLSLFVNLETSIRNFLLHLLANEDLSSSNVNYFMRDGDPIWKASIAYVYGRLASKSLDNMLPFENTEFYRIMQLRNTMTHNDILTNVDDQVDSKKTGGYLKFLQHDANKIQQFTKDHQIDIKYREFITIFSREFSEFSMIEEKLLGKITTSDFNKSLSQLTHNQNAFNLYFDNPKVVFKAQQVQKLLENRNLPWKSKIIHWPSNKSGQEIQIEINQELAKAEAEAVRRQDEIKSKLPTFFRETIHQILLSKCDEHNQIEQSTLKAEFRSLIVNARDRFSITNAQIKEILGLSSNAVSKGTVSILDWSGYTYIQTKREEVRFLEIEFPKDEEE